jgi:hypothetical protein
MLSCDPDHLAFASVRLNQAYKSSLCITNNDSTSVEFSIRSTSPRYSISPNRARLDAGKSIVVTVRLFVSATNPAPDATTSPKSDFLLLKTLYSEQRVRVSFQLFNKREGTTSRSLSPSRQRVSIYSPGDRDRDRAPDSPVPPLPAEMVPRTELQSLAKTLEQERLIFEEKSAKVSNF